MHSLHTHAQNNEETFAKYAVDANLFRLASTNRKKNIQALDVFWWAKPLSKKKKFLQKCFNI